MSADLGFVFVCQAGELELKACLLAASLRWVYGKDVALTAAVPHPSSLWGEISDLTAASLAENDVSIVASTNPIGQHYPIGNKLGAAIAAPPTRWTVVLDSDVLAMSAFEPSQLRTALAAKPVDRPGPWGQKRKWRKLYRRLGLTFARETVQTSVSKETIPPYFNAGVVVVEQRSGFLSEWVKMASRIDADQRISDRHPWLDQLALPLAAASLDIEVTALDDRHNYPAHYRLISPEPPYFVHYHAPEVIEEDRKLFDAVQALSKASPALEAVLRTMPPWSRLLSRSSPISRSSLVVLTQDGGVDLGPIIAGLRQREIAVAALDASIIRRLKGGDASWLATALRRQWLEHSDQRGQLVLVDHGGLVNARLAKQPAVLHGFGLALIASKRAGTGFQEQSRTVKRLDGGLNTADLVAAVVEMLSNHHETA